MRYLMWQFRHMHTLSFEIINGVSTCPRCGATYQKRTKTMTTNPNPDKPKLVKAPKSTLVLVTLLMLVSAFVTLLIAVIFSLPYVLAVAGLQGIASVTFAVLSLRETA